MATPRSSALPYSQHTATTPRFATQPPHNFHRQHSTGTTIVLTGALEKKQSSSFVGLYQRRYFTLAVKATPTYSSDGGSAVHRQEAVLYYYKSSEDYDAGKLPVGEIACVNVINIRREKETDFSLLTGSRTYQLRCKSGDECVSWMDAISQRIGQHARVSLHTLLNPTPRQLSAVLPMDSAALIASHIGQICSPSYESSTMSDESGLQRAPDADQQHHNQRHVLSPQSHVGANQSQSLQTGTDFHSLPASPLTNFNSPQQPHVLVYQPSPARQYNVQAAAETTQLSLSPTSSEGSFLALVEAPAAQQHQQVTPIAQSHTTATPQESLSDLLEKYTSQHKFMGITSPETTRQSQTLPVQPQQLTPTQKQQLTGMAQVEAVPNTFGSTVAEPIQVYQFTELPTVRAPVATIPDDNSMWAKATAQTTNTSPDSSLYTLTKQSYQPSTYYKPLLTRPPSPTPSEEARQLIELARKKRGPIARQVSHQPPVLSRTVSHQSTTASSTSLDLDSSEHTMISQPHHAPSKSSAHDMLSELSASASIYNLGAASKTARAAPLNVQTSAVAASTADISMPPSPPSGSTVGSLLSAAGQMHGRQQSAMAQTAARVNHPMSASSLPSPPSAALSVLPPPSTVQLRMTTPALQPASESRLNEALQQRQMPKLISTDHAVEDVTSELARLRAELESVRNRQSVAVQHRPITSSTASSYLNAQAQRQVSHHAAESLPVHDHRNHLQLPQSYAFGSSIASSRDPTPDFSDVLSQYSRASSQQRQRPEPAHASSRMQREVSSHQHQPMRATNHYQPHSVAPALAPQRTYTSPSADVGDLLSELDSLYPNQPQQRIRSITALSNGSDKSQRVTKQRPTAGRRAGPQDRAQLLPTLRSTDVHTAQPASRANRPPRAIRRPMTDAHPLTDHQQLQQQRANPQQATHQAADVLLTFTLLSIGMLMVYKVLFG